MPGHTLDQLRRGARIHSLIYAAHLAKNPDRRFDVSWNGLTYARCNAKGARGAFCFSKAGGVGLFFDPESPGNPQAAAPTGKKKPPPYKFEAHLQGMPPPLLQLAKRELLDTMEMDLHGKTQPVMTSVVWSNSAGELMGARPWSKLVSDGAHLVVDEANEPDKVVATFSERYGLRPEQSELVARVLGSKAKLAQSAARITLTGEDVVTLGIVLTAPTRELLGFAGVDFA